MIGYAALTSSKSCEWSTPQELFDDLNAEFSFNLDVCAQFENAKTARFFSEDSLSKRWEGSCFMNPPYGRYIGKWIRHAWEQSQLGATVVCLLPSRTDTRWWHDYCMRGEIRFIKGRLSFGRGRATFPSAIVIFRPNGRKA